MAFHPSIPSQKVERLTKKSGNCLLQSKRALLGTFSVAEVILLSDEGAVISLIRYPKVQEM